MDYTLKGRRVKLISTTDLLTNLKPGDEGTVSFADDAGTLWMTWDCGSNLGLIPGMDEWEFIDE